MEKGDLRRQADVHIICAATSQSYEAIVDLPSKLSLVGPETPVVTSWIALHELIQPSLHTEELLWAKELCRNLPKVKKACEATGVEKKAVADYNASKTRTWLIENPNETR
ncbi:hypothetical protein CNL05060 [Cryptococcus deneoformans JEC21]|uniref:Uncharacterized protein n=1 Tax=Cryptococcus deneoformans (strain JEC21 / ATCC MYA-565) TaxID=214684 RepID=A0A0S2M655_CRYD1|nr:hypothetical protein CNL05060 [Cryptococcus neoformans var. neoformans JEC21]ALO69692.1 hypothetical protein CNL05060 [Cryptococcus neoformans var. neoformans JEC21]